MNLTQQQIEEWVDNTAGVFHYTKIMDGLVNKDSYPVLRTIMHRMKGKGLAFEVPDKGDGWWRKADLEVEEVCWWDGDGEMGENIINLPLGLGEYAHISKPAVILVAGVYNQGKTAFCMNIIKQNIDKWADNMAYFVSEGAEQLQWKFRHLMPMMEKPPKFKTYRRYDNFADVILSDGLNVIDFLRTDMDKSYAISNKILEISRKTRGVTVLAMQKPPGRKLAFGGGSTAWEPSLYIAIDKGRERGESVLEFEKIKAPKLGIVGDPYTTKIYFNIRNGIQLTEGDTIVG